MSTEHVAQVYTSVDGDWIDIFLDEQRIFAGHHITPDKLLKLLSARIDGLHVAEWQEWEPDDAGANPTVHGVTLGERG